MSFDQTTSLAAEYEQYANRLLTTGHLGHGIQEDLLLASAAWFHQRLLPNGGAFADFFKAARERHVILICAVDLNPDSREDTADLHDFLSNILAWLHGLPLPFLEKSKSPLGLVVGWRGTGYNMGAQVMRRGGPAIINWGVFRSLRKSLNVETYEMLSEQIRQTLVHELIGHQMAFCTEDGPLLKREDLRQILQVCGIKYLKLLDTPAVSVDSFLSAKDLLAAINRIQYYSARRNAQKYFANITELIAFAIQGRGGLVHAPYENILSVLKHDFLRIGKALRLSDDGGDALYEGYDFSKPAPEKYFIQKTDGQWCETAAICQDERWVTLQDQRLAWRDAAKTSAPIAPSGLQSLNAGQNLVLDVSKSGYYFEIEQARYLVCPFGLFAEAENELTDQCLEDVTCGSAAIHVLHFTPTNIRGIQVTNSGSTTLPFMVVPLTRTG